MRWNEIFTESEQLNELFDQVGEWKWTFHDECSWNAEFEVNGQKYFMDIFTQPGQTVWGAEFKSASAWGKERWGNLGNMPSEASQVFGTVIAILKAFIKEVQPEGLQFSGYKNEKRDGLYRKMIEHQKSDITKLGYDVTAIDSEKHIDFCFKKKTS